MNLRWMAVEVHYVTGVFSFTWHLCCSHTKWVLPNCRYSLSVNRGKTSVPGFILMISWWNYDLLRYMTFWRTHWGVMQYKTLYFTDVMAPEGEHHCKSQTTFKLILLIEPQNTFYSYIYVSHTLWMQPIVLCTSRFGAFLKQIQAWHQLQKVETWNSKTKTVMSVSHRRSHYCKHSVQTFVVVVVVVTLAP